MVATRAGLEWIGKTDLLITKKFGPRLRLTSILLKDRVIPESKHIDISRCGTCNICVEICPAKQQTEKSGILPSIGKSFSIDGDAGINVPSSEGQDYQWMQESAECALQPALSDIQILTTDKMDI